MSDKSPNDTSSNGERDSESNEGAKELLLENPMCIKLPLDEHIGAYKDNTNLERDIEQLTCDSDLIDKVILNYIIVKQILSNLSWQDKVMCKQVCSTWRSAVNALRREELAPIDFIMDLRSHSLTWAVLKQSSSFTNEPLAVITFVNGSGMDMTAQCKLIDPSPCAKLCSCDHSLLDAMVKLSSAPKECMNLIRSDYLSFLPIPHSLTYKHAISNLKQNPYMVGLYIPVIPDVKLHTISIKSIEKMQEEFYDVVTAIAKERIFKGIFVYITDKYLLHSVQDIIFVNHFKELQPDIPYALGGCIIEDTIFDQKDMNGLVEGINNYKDYYSENVISISMFTIPKNPQSNECNFDMYSLVLDSSAWSKPNIEKCIKEFGKRVPRFEHSAVLKLSCVGRDPKHKWEQDCFRAVFPKTILVGCYGNGELGINHPAKPAEESSHSSAKRQCLDSGPQFGIMYSYSTVFVYMGWGKILSTPVSS